MTGFITPAPVHRLIGLLLFATAIVISSTASATDSAEEIITLDHHELEQLDIRFAAVRAVQAGDGTRLSATVVNAPDFSDTVIVGFSGQLQQWHVRPGDRLEAGDPVARLSSETLLQHQQDWLDALSREQLASSALTREQTLHEAGVIAAQRLEQAEAAAILAAQQERTARQRLLQSGQSMAQLQALREGEATPGEYELLANRSGQVARQLVSAGSYLQAGEAVLSLRGEEGSWLMLRIPARQGQTLNLGQTLHLPDIGQQAEIATIDLSVDPMSQTLTVMARLAGDHALLPGQRVSVTLPVDTQTLLVPSQAVVRESGQALVFVRHSEGVAVRAVTLLPVGMHYGASNGLVAGDEVVVRGAALLRGMQLGLGGEE